MPELPEVETIRQDLRRLLLNKEIVNVSVLLPRLIKSNLENFKTTLKGNTFADIDRIGKLLIFKLSTKPSMFLLVHLKMTGQLVYCSNNTMVAGGHSDNKELSCQNKYSYVIFSFKSGEKLYFNDMRTFGSLKIVNEVELDKEIKKFGIEPLQNSFSLDALEKIISSRTTNIKALLLNQKLISGIGNIYADEILFRSNILPDRIANTLSKSEIKKLYNKAETIIQDAIKNRGTTFNNYVDGQGQKGSFVKKLKVYGRGGLPCLSCSKQLKKIKLAGRGTVYCPHCQK